MGHVPCGPCVFYLRRTRSERCGQGRVGVIWRIGYICACKNIAPTQKITQAEKYVGEKHCFSLQKRDMQEVSPMIFKVILQFSELSAGLGAVLGIIFALLFVAFTCATVWIILSLRKQQNAVQQLLYYALEDQRARNRNTTTDPER